MQPKQTMKKTLLASALILGLGNAFHASSEVFPVTAGAVSDVDITQHGTLGDNEISFGNRIKLNPAANSTCTLVAVSNAFEDDILVNVDGDDTDNTADALTGTAVLNDTAGPAAHALGDIASGSTGCIGDTTTGGSSGSYMVLEVTGTAGTTVSVDIPNVTTGAGWTYSAGDQSCVVDFDGTAGAGLDSCRDFDGVQSLAGVGLSIGAADIQSGNDLENNLGQTHIMLGGILTFDGSPITPGAVSETIVVTVSYE